MSATIQPLDTLVPSYFAHPDLERQRQLLAEHLANEPPRPTDDEILPEPPKGASREELRDWIEWTRQIATQAVVHLVWTEQLTEMRERVRAMEEQAGKMAVTDKLNGYRRALDVAERYEHQLMESAPAALKAKVTRLETELYDLLNRHPRETDQDGSKKFCAYFATLQEEQYHKRCTVEAGPDEFTSETYVNSCKKRLAELDPEIAAITAKAEALKAEIADAKRAAYMA